MVFSLEQQKSTFICMTRQIDKVRFSYLDLPRVVEWMIRGSLYNIQHPSGFKQHPFKDAGKKEVNR